MTIQWFISGTPRRLALWLTFGVLSTSAISANAGLINVDVSGWQATGNFGDAGNTSVFLNVGAGASITGFDWIDLTFEALGASWLEEFVLSVNNSSGTAYMDVAPADGRDFAGVFGPSSGSWGSAGFLFVGAPFTVADGVVWVTVYDYFLDGGVNARIRQGTLRIHCDNCGVGPTPIPAPGTLELLGLSLAGLAALRGRQVSAGFSRIPHSPGRFAEVSSLWRH
jgi:hypothetical protein